MTGARDDEQFLVIAGKLAVSRLAEITGSLPAALLGVYISADSVIP